MQTNNYAQASAPAFPQQAHHQHGQANQNSQAPRQNNGPIDKGRIMGVVDEYQDKNEQGQLLVNPDGTPKMKPKWWPIGEMTKWQSDKGVYVTRTVFVKPLKPGIYQQREYWDSESQQN